jgi:hypothetical protein
LDVEFGDGMATTGHGADGEAGFGDETGHMPPDETGGACYENRAHGVSYPAAAI